MNSWKEYYLADRQNNSSFLTRMFLRFFRKGQFCCLNNKRFQEKVCRIICSIILLRNNQFPFEAVIGSGLKLPHLMGIVISGGCVIGNNSTIFQQVTIGANERDEHPKIGSNVIIGAGAKVIGNVTVGDYVKIGANAVITKNVPSNCIVVGNNKIFKGTS